MAQTYYVVPVEQHDALVRKVYEKRGYLTDEAADGARFCQEASWHGIRTHNAIKALHLDELFGSKVGGWKPGSQIREVESRFKASRIWDSNYKLGMAVAYRAMEQCMEMADEYGVGIVSVDRATHYLWGGGYVMDAAKKGYIAYTNCTSTLAEVVPFMGKFPTLGTNPHSWGFPTTDAIGYPIVIDWATSTVAMGRVQQFKREGKELPPNCAVDVNGTPTTDPEAAVALLPFGAHKGYGLGLIDELVGAFIGGSLPTIRGRKAPSADEKTSSSFFFQVIHPDAINGGAFAQNRDQAKNIKAVLEDILGHGNENCLLPGQIEADAAALSEKHQGLLFTEAEIHEFRHLCEEAESDIWNTTDFKQVSE